MDALYRQYVAQHEVQEALFAQTPHAIASALGGEPKSLEEFMLTRSSRVRARRDDEQFRKAFGF